MFIHSPPPVFSRVQLAFTWKWYSSPRKAEMLVPILSGRQSGHQVCGYAEAALQRALLSPPAPRPLSPRGITRLQETKLRSRQTWRHPGVDTVRSAHFFSGHGSEHIRVTSGPWMASPLRRSSHRRLPPPGARRQSLTPFPLLSGLLPGLGEVLRFFY